LAGVLGRKIVLGRGTNAQRLPKKKKKNEKRYAGARGLSRHRQKEKSYGNEKAKVDLFQFA